MNQNSEGIYLTPFQRQMLAEKIAKEPHNAYRQRLEIILLTDRGQTQAAICRTLGCSAGTASRWIQLTKAGLAHQYLDCPVGRPKVVTDEYIELLRELLEHSPRDYGYPFKTWTIDWLGKHIAKEQGIAVSHSHLKRVMRELGLSTRTKPQQPQSSSTANIFIADLPDVAIESVGGSGAFAPAIASLQENRSAKLSYQLSTTCTVRVASALAERSRSRSVSKRSINSQLIDIQLDSKIYGAAFSSSTCLPAAARRDFSDFAYPQRISILSR